MNLSFYILLTILAVLGVKNGFSQTKLVNERFDPYLVKIKSDLSHEIGTGYIFKWKNKKTDKYEVFIRTAAHVVRSSHQNSRIEKLQFYVGSQKIKVSHTNFIIDNDTDDAIFEIENPNNDVIGAIGEFFEFHSPTREQNVIIVNRAFAHQLIKQSPYCLDSVSYSFYLPPSWSDKSNELLDPNNCKKPANKSGSKMSSYRSSIADLTFHRKEIRASQNSLYFIADVKIAPGESGSPVISGFRRENSVFGLYKNQNLSVENIYLENEYQNFEFFMIPGHVAAHRYLFRKSLLVAYNSQKNNLFNDYLSGLRGYISNTSWHLRDCNYYRSDDFAKELFVENNKSARGEYAQGSGCKSYRNSFSVQELNSQGLPGMKIGGEIVLGFEVRDAVDSFTLPATWTNYKYIETFYQPQWVRNRTVNLHQLSFESLEKLVQSKLNSNPRLVTILKKNKLLESEFNCVVYLSENKVSISMSHSATRKTIGEIEISKESFFSDFRSYFEFMASSSKDRFLVDISGIYSTNSSHISQKRMSILDKDTNELFKPTTFQIFSSFPFIEVAKRSDLLPNSSFTWKPLFCEVSSKSNDKIRANF